MSDKPERISISVCTKCGKPYEEHGHARACMKQHIEPRKLQVKTAHIPLGGEYYYRPGQRYPTVIEVWCEESQKTVLYKIVDGDKPPPEQVKGKANSPMLLQ